jgi:hypothetical protein
MESFGKIDTDGEYQGVVGSEGNLDLKNKTLNHLRHASPFSDKTEKLSYEQGDFNSMVEP